MSESTTGVVHAAELSSLGRISREVGQGVESPHPPEGVWSPHLPVLPEEVGRQAAELLIEEIVKVQCLTCMYCVYILVIWGSILYMHVIYSVVLDVLLQA